MRNAIVFSGCLFAGLALVAASGIPAASAPAGSLPPSPAPDDCPLASISTTDGTNYAVYFSAQGSATATFAIRMFARDGDYVWTAPPTAISISSAYTDGTPFVRSTTFDLRKQSGAEVLGASVVATLASGHVCAAQRLLVDSAEETRTQRASAPEGDALFRRIDFEAAHHVENLSREPATAFPCRVPFSDARATNIVEPDYPDAANGAFGSATVKIQMNDSDEVVSATIFHSTGNSALDSAALDAASKSHFASERFACNPQPGSYLYVAEFDKPPPSPTPYPTPKIVSGP